MIIPGKKRPAGIHTPYVVIVKIYQTKVKTARSAAPYVNTSYLLKSVLIELPSVLKNRDANGLYI